MDCVVRFRLQLVLTVKVKKTKRGVWPMVARWATRAGAGVAVMSELSEVWAWGPEALGAQTVRLGLPPLSALLHTCMNEL